MRRAILLVVFASTHARETAAERTNRWVLADGSGHAAFSWTSGHHGQDDLVVHLEFGSDNSIVDTRLSRIPGAYAGNASVTIMQGELVTKRAHVSGDSAITYSSQDGTIVFSVVGEKEHLELDGIVVRGDGVLHLHAKADGTLDVTNDGDVLGVCGMNASHHDHHRRLLVERWTNCYDGDTTTRSFSIGVVIGSGLFSRKFSDDEDQVTAWLNSVVAEANVIYRAQLNLALTVGEIVIQSGSQASPSWDDPNCQLGLSSQLRNFRSYQQPSRQGLWHLFDDCYGRSGSSIGLATMLVADPAGTICMMDKVNGGSEYWNTAVSWYSSNTWKTFAHEIGHNFGASHSFEEGQGSTGGIMDYGDGKLNGQYQFNTKYRKTEVCKSIQKVIGSCSAFSILSGDSTSTTTADSGDTTSAGSGATTTAAAVPSTSAVLSTSIKPPCNSECADSLGLRSSMTFNGVRYTDCASLISATNAFGSGYWCKSRFESQFKVCQQSCGACTSECGQDTTVTTTIAPTSTTSTTAVTITIAPTSTTTTIASTSTTVTSGQDSAAGIQSGDTIFLKSRSGGGNHIDIQGNAVQARWQSRGDWQAIVIEKTSGGTLASGDTVYLRAHTGAYLDIESGTVQARWNDKGAWQAMIVERKTGSGGILPSDLVCFRAHTGKHIDVEGTSPQVRWDDCGDLQTFVIEKEVLGAVSSGDSVHLLAHTGKRIDVQGDAVQARWAEAGEWQTFVIQNYGGRAIYSGDTIFLTANTDVYVDVQDIAVQARWNDRGSWQQFVIERKSGAGAVLPGDSIFLRAHTGNFIDVQGDAVQARWSERGDWQSLVIEKSTLRRLGSQSGAELEAAVGAAAGALVAVLMGSLLAIIIISLRRQKRPVVAHATRAFKVVPTKATECDASSD